MARIGQLLVRAGLVSDNNVARALGIQQFAGGRLGTLLLERGSIDEDSLGQTLAVQHGCEYISWKVLSDVSAVVIAALPAKFAIKHAAIPYGRGENFLKIALRDPGDLRILDELFFVTGRKVIAGVTPEVRIYQALEKYYGERRTPRYAILAEKISRPVRASRASAPAPPPPPDFFPSPPRKPGAPPAQQDLWGELSEQDVSEPRIVQTWKIPDQQVGGWAGTVSPGGADSAAPTEPETISWEEMPSFSALWIPEPVPPLPELSPPPPSAPATAVEQTPPAASEEPAPSTPVTRQPVAVASTTPAEPPPMEALAPPAPATAPEEAPAPPAAPSAALPPPTLEPTIEEPPSPPSTEAPAPAASEVAASAEEPEEAAEIASAPALSAPSPAPRLVSDFPEVSSAADRDAIAAAALAALARRFPRGAFFVSKPDVVVAWAGFGNGVSADELKSLAVPWKEPSVFLNIRLSRSFYLGALPPLPRHEPLAIAMGAWAQECLVQPIMMKEKPVAFLYAEFAPDQGATPMDLAYMRELAAAASSAFASSIRLKKKQI